LPDFSSAILLRSLTTVARGEVIRVILTRPFFPPGASPRPAPQFFQGTGSRIQAGFPTPRSDFVFGKSLPRKRVQRRHLFAYVPSFFFRFAFAVPAASSVRRPLSKS